MAAKRPLVHSGGSFVELPDADTLRLTQLAVADGATTPDPGSPVWAWSTTENAPVYWSGSAWVKPATGASPLTVPESVDAIYVDLYIPTDPATLSISTGPVLDTTLPPYTVDNGIGLEEGQVLFVKHATYSGIWVVGSLAVPSAVPLTRHADWPATARLRPGTKIVARHAFPERPAGGAVFDNGVGDVTVAGLGVNTTTDQLTGVTAPRLAGGFFKFVSLDTGASLPGGLTLGTWYGVSSILTFSNDPFSLGGYASVYDLTFSPVDFTTTGTDGSGFYLGTINYLGYPSRTAVLEVAGNSAEPDGSWLITDSSVLQLYSSMDSGFSAGQFNRGNVTAGTDSLALGEFSTAYGEYNTALGNRSKALGASSTAVGSYSEARNGGLALGQSARAFGASVALNAQAYDSRSLALGKSAFSYSQVAFLGPSGRFRDTFELHQLYLDSTAWAVASYPTKLYTSDDQRTATPTRSGWRAYGTFGGTNSFSGRCCVTFTNTSSQMVGHAVLRLEGSCRVTNVSVLPTLVYSVTELESSFPGALTLTLTASEDPVDPTAMIEVELSCSISIATVTVDAYLGVLVWGVHSSSDSASAYTAPIVNRQERGVLLTASETLAAGDFVNFWSDGGTAKMRKADASDDRAADGYVLQAVASGDKGYAFVDGVNTAVTGLTVGPLYLGESGAASSTAAGAGSVVQSVGFATSATSAVFQRGLPVQF